MRNEIKCSGLKYSNSEEKDLQVMYPASPIAHPQNVCRWMGVEALGSAPWHEFTTHKPISEQGEVWAATEFSRFFL